MSAAANKQPLFSDYELENARLDVLRKRVRWFSMTIGILVVVLAAIQTVIVFTLIDPSKRPTIVSISIGALAGIAILLTPLLKRTSVDQLTLRRLVWRTLLLVLVAVLTQVIGAAVLARGMTELLRPFGFQGNLGALFPLALFLFCAHLTGVLIFPWTAWEACVPPVGLCLISFLASAFIGNDTMSFRLIGLILPLVAGLPGIAVAVLRSNSLRTALGLRLIGARYAEIERELTFARRIHERLFPPQFSTGPLHLTFRFEPMMQLGGDYLDATQHPDGSITLTLIDVTGHGFGAALAVNRLHGELKRIAAQNPGAAPSQVIAALNDYIFLTLADESVYATAIALRVTLSGQCTLCIAGHPPALVRHHSGALETIESNAPMLGLFAASDFAAENAVVQLESNDYLVLYTDGAIEVRDIDGHQLGIKGFSAQLTRTSQSSPTSLVDQLMSVVKNHRAGAAEDDTLIVAISRADAAQHPSLNASTKSK